MGKVVPVVDDALRDWIAAQRVFFVASAPSGDGGHVNCSPRGGDALRVLSPTTIAWPDRAGSGIETIAHLRQNGRIVVMLCAFEGPPRIVRLHGRGEVVVAGTAEFERLQPSFPGPWLGVRAIVRVELSRISDSCGFGVPLLQFVGQRDTMRTWAEKKGEAGVANYVKEKNARSLDGLPGLDGLG
ncbi:MAG: pyridoxamine 5'-phosphate oxidase family protein [Planctomycetes bacterium]|nr:pyridoxamine 5'-phosphate oxidase family protein [Planctomycetota bacterium]